MADQPTPLSGDAKKWEWLMFAARLHANVFNKRARVIAVKLPARAARRRGVGWAYVIDAPWEEFERG